MNASPPVPMDLAHAAAHFVSKHCVALLRPDPKQAGQVAMVGSGTLVRLRGRRFILTATHVWQALRNHPVVHYTLVQRMNHSAQLNRQALTAHSLPEVPDGHLTPTSPDLTLLELNPIDADLIETRLSFMNLSRPFVARDDEISQDILVAGAPGELGKPELNHLSFELRGVFAEGDVEWDTEGDFEFITLKPTQELDSPISFRGGVSGGGLWLISYFPKSGGGIDYEIFLLGVVFWQDGERIRCHSRKSVTVLAQQMLGTT
jgi:hypothetical protein